MSTAEEYGLDPDAFHHATNKFIYGDGRARRLDLLAQVIVTYLEHAGEAPTDHGD